MKEKILKTRWYICRRTNMTYPGNYAVVLRHGYYTRERDASSVYMYPGTLRYKPEFEGHTTFKGFRILNDPNHFVLDES